MSEKEIKNLFQTFMSSDRSYSEIIELLRIIFGIKKEWVHRIIEKSVVAINIMETLAKGEYILDDDFWSLHYPVLAEDVKNTINDRGSEIYV